MNYSHLIHERSLTTTPHRQKPIIEPLEYPVVFLTQKTSRTEFNLSFLWWKCGICLTAIATEGQSRAAEGVHTAMPCCDFTKSQ